VFALIKWRGFHVFCIDLSWNLSGVSELQITISFGHQLRPCSIG
jgi:hypothetical protein